MSLSFTLPKWYDLHAQMRHGAMLAPMVQQHLAMGCAGVVAMPDTTPPITKIMKSDPGANGSIEDYLTQIRSGGGHVFSDIIVPLYLSEQTSAQMIAYGAASGLLRCAKYTPPGHQGGADITHFMNNGVLAAMEEHGIILSVHGEAHGLAGQDYFDRYRNAEAIFYEETMHLLCAAYPKLKIVAEHISTKVAVDFVNSKSDRVAATITPQHLLYTVGDMLRGFKYHLYCVPPVKFEEDRQALRDAVTDPLNIKFFAGTASAAHTVKTTSYGGVAGCFTAGIAPQLYAQAFDESGANLALVQTQETFMHFLSANGARFYDLPVPSDHFTLTRVPQEIHTVKTELGPLTPLPIGMLDHPSHSTALEWSLAC